MRRSAESIAPLNSYLQPLCIRKMASFVPLSGCTRLTTLRYIASTTSSFLTRSRRLHAILLSQS